MDCARSQDVTLAPAKAALLTAEDGFAKSGRPLLRLKGVVMKYMMKWKDIKRHDWQSKALNSQTLRTIIQPKT